MCVGVFVGEMERVTEIETVCEYYLHVCVCVCVCVETTSV